MTKYVIERDLPNAHKLSLDELRGVAKRSNEVLREMAPDVQWLESYVTEDKIYCVYNAKSSEHVAEHARRGGFPANRIAPVRGMMDPNTESA